MDPKYDYIPYSNLRSEYEKVYRFTNRVVHNLLSRNGATIRFTTESTKETIFK